MSVTFLFLALDATDLYLQRRKIGTNIQHCIDFFLPLLGLVITLDGFSLSALRGTGYKYNRVYGGKKSIYARFEQ